MTFQESNPLHSPLPIGRADRAQGSMEGPLDNSLVKMLANKSVPLGDRYYEGKNRPSGWILRSFLTAYIKAKRKVAQKASDRPPWWPRFR
jgi:hypothetical protein